MRGGYRQIHTSFWSKTEPGVVSVVQLLLNPDTSDAEVAASLQIIQSVDLARGGANY
jgi:hypothetical protein